MSRIRRFVALTGVLAVLSVPLSSTTALAQHHGGHGHRGGFSHYGGYGHHGATFRFGFGFGTHGYYPPYYSYHGGYPYYGYGYGYAPYSYYDYGYYGSGAVRLQVQPNEARVFVDDCYVGVVDDFDGSFQRLQLPPGRHEIAVKLRGYRTHRFHIYAAPGRTTRLRYDMTQGTGEDEPDDLAGEGSPSADREGATYRGSRRADPGAGEVRMTVRPEDASVYVDGEFQGVGEEVRRLDLSPGRHRIEVARPGYRGAERDLEIVAGQPAALDVELSRD